MPGPENCSAPFGYWPSQSANRVHSSSRTAIGSRACPAPHRCANIRLTCLRTSRSERTGKSLWIGVLSSVGKAEVMEAVGITGAGRKACAYKK